MLLAGALTATSVAVSLTPIIGLGARNRLASISALKQNLAGLALLATVCVGLGAAVTPVNAVMLGEAGEALLIPLVQHSDPPPGVGDTYIRVTVPGTIGFDAIPNGFTAPHTTPTNPGPTDDPADADLMGGNAIHWYWFDRSGTHRRNGRIPVTANDVVWLDWLKLSGGAFAGEAGYMIVGTETGRTGAAADFAMFGEAWVDYYSAGQVGSKVPIPVLPLNDGPDGGSSSAVSVADNVKYSAGIPRAASPLYSGMRTNRSDGELNDTTVFNLSLGAGGLPALHVIWLDMNPGGASRPLVLEPADDEEHVCSGTVDQGSRSVRVLVVPQHADATDQSCTRPESDFGTTEPQRGFGFVRYSIPEYIDTGIGAPESAGVAFSIMADSDAGGRLRYTSTPAQVRGTFK